MFLSKVPLERLQNWVLIQLIVMPHVLGKVQIVQNKRNVPINRTVSSNWHQRVNHQLKLRNCHSFHTWTCLGLWMLDDALLSSGLVSVAPLFVLSTSESNESGVAGVLQQVWPLMQLYSVYKVILSIRS